MEIGNALVPICLALVFMVIIVLITVIFVYRKLNVIEKFFNTKTMTPQEMEKAEETMTNSLLKCIPFNGFKPPPPPATPASSPQATSKLPLVVEESMKNISDDEESEDSETE